MSDTIRDTNDDFNHYAEAARMFNLIGNPVAEIRAIPRPDDTTRNLAVGLFRDVREFGDTAAGLGSLTSPNELYAGVYMTVNRIAKRFVPMITETMGKGYAVKDHQIDRIVTLFLDLDPTRDHPLSGKVCATEAEHAAALALAGKIADFMRSLGWPEPLVMDSGSGAYVIFRVDLPNNRESVTLIGNALKAFAAKFDSPAVHVDTGVSNPSRVVRIAGTWNRKSEHTKNLSQKAMRCSNGEHGGTTVGHRRIESGRGS